MVTMLIEQQVVISSHPNLLHSENLVHCSSGFQFYHPETKFKMAALIVHQGIFYHPETQFKMAPMLVEQHIC
jgi:hypothetical protein